MPVIAAVVGAVMTGLMYYFIYGNGMEQLDRFLGDRRNAKLRARSAAAFRAAPLRAIRDPADAAGVLMMLVALARGTPTPEQEAAIEAEMRKVTSPQDDHGTRMAYIRHAAAQASDADTAVDHLAPLLREKLDDAERDELEQMLEAVAVIHGGPIEAQEKLIARTVRVLAEQH
ncbi:hypothetical protein C0214_15575 [Methylobacterium sp. DM1]|uniref:Co-chaperone DjlA N-terminal domain-containing protein n=3 Tax=Methylorubrum aminovorans TaxID=269069 RepID=A0ABQ4UCA6_9HYPH|nr:hypothetical protein [Methylorubrum aminovorans]AWI91713.1 hypothetical protein C0214_15575 [Methylobacterium sp. DM1]QIJ75380.1 hypothetical protein CLZ_12720 [Methylobacterium sp. CLZ]QIJ80284.1 hypothetical protein GU700_12720 [Methylobacterium sp. NI91]GJE63410.1 hypothetical protein LNAOJCKE_0607 [Methylorubrum aminovorans]GMA79487.1 hypothetical protein GCM10025880_59040 [Methylorubrum aminovorans]